MAQINRFLFLNGEPETTPSPRCEFVNCQASEADFGLVSRLYLPRSALGRDSEAGGPGNGRKLMSDNGLCVRGDGANTRGHIAKCDN